MRLEQAMALPDVSPVYGQEEFTIGDIKVVIPFLSSGKIGALYQRADDGEFTDLDGVRWTTGWLDGEHVRSRL